MSGTPIDALPPTVAAAAPAVPGAKAEPAAELEEARDPLTAPMCAVHGDAAGAGCGECQGLAAPWGPLQRLELASLGEELLTMAAAGRVPTAAIFATPRVATRLQAALGAADFRVFVTLLKHSAHVPHVCVLDHCAHSFQRPCSAFLCAGKRGLVGA